MIYLGSHNRTPIFIPLSAEVLPEFLNRSGRVTSEEAGDDDVGEPAEAARVYVDVVGEAS